MTAPTGRCIACHRKGAPLLCFNAASRPVYLHTTKACEAKFESMPINPPKQGRAAA